MSHIFEALRTAIPKQPDLAALFSLADSSNIDPSIIVVIESGQAEASDPIELWKVRSFKFASADVAPQTDARSSKVGKRQVHPTIFVEVESDHPGGGHWRFALPGIGGAKGAFARVKQDHRLGTGRTHHEIHRAVIIEVGGYRAQAAALASDPGFAGHIGESAIAVVAPE